METNLFTLLVLATCYHLVAYWRSGAIAPLLIALLMCLLSTLTRPEGFGVFLLVFGVHVGAVLVRGDRQELIQTLALMSLVYGLGFLGYFVWRTSYFGELLPNTFYAKTGGTTEQWYRGFKYFAYFGFHYLLPLVPLGMVLAAEASVSGLPGKDAVTKSFAKQPARWVGSLVCIAVPIFYAAYVVLVGGVAPQGSWTVV